MKFSEVLAQQGLKKRDIADLMGVNPATVSRWGEHPPKYVWTYLNERQSHHEANIEKNRLRDALELLIPCLPSTP